MRAAFKGLTIIRPKLYVFKDAAFVSNSVSAPGGGSVGMPKQAVM